MEMLKEMNMENLEKQAMKEIAEEYGLELIDENDDVLIGFITLQSLLQAIKKEECVVISVNSKTSVMSGKSAYKYLHRKINRSVLCTVEGDGEFIIGTMDEEYIIEF